MHRRRRRFRRFQRRLPMYAFALAVLAFFLAAAFPSEPITGPSLSLPVQPSPSLPDREPAPPLESQGVEPVIPEEATEPELPMEADIPDKSAWNLVLANSWNPLSKDYTFTQTTLTNGLAVDARCYPDLQAMMDACRAAGLSPVICSAYRSYEKQEELYRNKVDRLLAQGLSRSDAETEAARVVALPGTSEHQTGLAMDIVDVNDQNLDESQEDTAVQKWLMEHSWEYGFILRYPNGKSDITGIIYEPWHYRYVGKEAAAEIYEQGICLEEYLAA